MARNIALSAFVTSLGLLVGCLTCCEAAMSAVSAGSHHHALVGEHETVD